MQPELLVTVDHGIACHAGITAAKARGWQVLVTDHHLPGEVLPPADAIVDPNLADDAFPSKMLAGVGVMFYVLLALRRELREAGAFSNGGIFAGEPDLSTLLDLVAVGTVADLVPLDSNNRALVGAGLRRLRAGQGCAGLNALIEIGLHAPPQLTDIGFSMAPRLMQQDAWKTWRSHRMPAHRRCTMHARIARSLTHQCRASAACSRNGRRAQALLDGSSLRDLPQACAVDAQWHGRIGLVASK